MDDESGSHIKHFSITYAQQVEGTPESQALVEEFDLNPASDEVSEECMSQVKHKTVPTAYKKKNRENQNRSGKKLVFKTAIT